MKHLVLFCLAAVLAACASTGPVPDGPPVFTASVTGQRIYRIGHGDLLHISVWKEDSLTRQASVLPDGNITLPLIGDVRAEGLTVSQLKTEIVGRLKRYMPNAVVSVEVIKPGSMVIYVLGKVNSPGNFLIHEQITVMQALALARGLNPFADKNNIRVFRTVDGKDYIFAFDYEALARGKNLKQNILLERGDMIVVQ
ncbi:polysaccharide biosynthesis/export family protein [Desulfatiferula olefinivorans]